MSDYPGKVPGLPPWISDPAGRGFPGDTIGQAAERQFIAELTGAAPLAANVHATVAAEAAAANNGAATIATDVGLTPAQEQTYQGALGEGMTPTRADAAQSPAQGWLAQLLGTLYGLFQRFGIIIAAIVLMGLGAYAMLHKTTVIEAAKSVGKS